MGIIAILAFTIGCSSVQAQKNARSDGEEITVSIPSDSLELLDLTKNLLKWHEADFKGDFLPTSDNDNIYIGIDWSAHKARMVELSKTNFFTAEFMKNYEEIALQLDKELKQNPIKYYKGELPPYGNDASEWCNCQDYPSNIWEHLGIRNIKQGKDIVSYYWTWGEGLNYFVQAKLENGKWKIAYLEGFDKKNYTWK